MQPRRPDHAIPETVLAARRGDRDALDTLMRRHLPALQAFIRLRMDARLRARESVVDVAQSVCRQVLEDIDRFEWRGEHSFRNWLFTHAANKVLSRRNHWHAERRDVGRELPLADTDGSVREVYATICTPSQHAAANEWEGQFEAAMDRLPEHYREVVLLSRVAGLSGPDIARRLGITEQAVRTRLSRALNRLAALLDSRQAGDRDG